MKHLITTDLKELQEWLISENEPKFRAKQIYSWIFDKMVLSPKEMKNIPLHLREKIEDNFYYNDTNLLEVEKAGDNTEKLLIELYDSESIENVIIKTDKRTTFCLSSQVGCPVQCRFCASGMDGLVRNLTAAEILTHYMICCNRIGGRPDNIVFMGIGEPLMNMKHLSEALNILTDPDKFAISPRRITISTSGWTDGIKKLANLKKPYNLAISLHASDDETREKLIPEKFRKPLSEILEACIEYREKTTRMVTFEYTLIKDINDSNEQAEELAKLAKQHRAKINLIPWNKVDGTGFEQPTLESVHNFLHILEKRRIQVTCRMRKGDKVNAACGQLRRHTSKKNR